MPNIDSDAHVVETPRTWSFMAASEQQFRPQIFVRDPSDGAPHGANQRNEYWKVGERFQTKTNVGSDVPREARDLVDIRRRLDHMDEIGIDVQVLFPTLFLRPVTTEHDCELALVKSYNRWVADAWKRSGNRLRWVAAPPLYSLPDPGKVRAELAFAKDNGACGVFMRGFECERLASDRYFTPLYEIASELDLAICFHAGNNSFANHDSYARDLGVMIFKFPVMGVFLELLTEQLPRRYPRLRWAFIEASAQWVPYMLREAVTRLKSKGARAPDTLLTDCNFYITTQKSDDLPWLVDELGDDNLVIGTDYGHKDTAVEIEALMRLSRDGGIPQASATKIVAANPGRLYGLA